MRFARAILCLTLIGLLAACGSGKSPPPPYPGIKIGKPYQIYGRWYEPKYNSHYDEIGVASWYGPGFHGGRTASGETFDQDALTAAHKTLPLPSIVRVTNLSNGRSALIKINDRGPFAHNRIIDLSRGSAAKLGVIRTGTARVRVQFLEAETKEYVQNMLNGTQYAMEQVQTVNPEAASAREEEDTRPHLRIESKMFTENATPMRGMKPTPPVPPPGTTMVQNGDEFVIVDNVDEPQVPLPAPHATAKAAKPTASYEPQDFYSALTPPSNNGFFIQAGTFPVEEKAVSLSGQIGNSGTPQVMQVMMNGQRYYRVMVGPYRSQRDAKKMLSKLASIGIPDAKIIRN